MTADDRTRFILVRTSHAGNVGAAARALKVMGFRDLVLVEPRFPDVLQRDEARAFASGAEDVLAGALVVGRWDEALDGVTHLCATAMTPRDFGPVAQTPRTALASLAPAVAMGQRVAFVFGSERFGLANDEVWRCHSVLTIPTHPDYGSLNLAQAVQVIAYEWRQALGGFGAADPDRETRGEGPGMPGRATRVSRDPFADARAIQGVLAHWQEALVAVGYLDPQAPKKLLPRLNQLANRLALTEPEVHILRGIASAMVNAAADSRSYTARPPPT
jgi:tRNA/rRNA methyltransferase